MNTKRHALPRTIALLLLIGTLLTASVAGQTSGEVVVVRIETAKGDITAEIYVLEPIGRCGSGYCINAQLSLDFGGYRNLDG